MNLPEYKLIGRPRRIRAKGVLVANYYQFYRLPPDLKVMRAPCCHDRQQSERKAIYHVEQHIKKGMAKDDPVIACAGHTIEQHLTTYRESLEADEDTPKHVSVTINRIVRICKGLHWKTISDIDGLKLKYWLKNLTKDYPWQSRLAKEKVSYTTRKYYATAFKSFTKFLAQNRRIEQDPLLYFTVKTKGDKPEPTKIRRALTPDETNRLIRAAEASKAVVRELTGEQRAWLYRLTVAVGFRAHEMASLTPQSFNLDEACVLLERSVSKRRRYDRVEIHQSLLDGLREWLADKRPDRPLWPGSWWTVAARMLRRDMKVADIPPVDDDNHVVDFHALRTTFITNLVGTSVPITLVQRIARLSTPALLDRYYKPADSARAEAIAAMPVFV